MAASPEDVQPEFLKRFNAGDIDALMSLYEPDAAFVPQPGTLVTGTAAIREALNGFLALKGTLEHKEQTVVPAGELALLHGEWLLRHPDENGNPVEMPMRSTEVVRRQPDGSWCYIIDNPFTP